MVGKLVNVEDFVTNRPVKVLVLTPKLPGEAAAFKRLKDSDIRSLRVVFGDGARDIQIVLPDCVSGVTGEG